MQRFGRSSMMSNNASISVGARMARVFLAMLFAVGFAVIATGLEAFLPQSPSHVAYASTWTDDWIKQIDALPAADKMNMSQAEKAISLRDQLTDKYNRGELSDEDLLAVGSARLRKCTDASARKEYLEEQALNAKKKAFAKQKVKGVKVKVKKGKVKVSWKKVSGATGYEVYASKKKNGKYRLVDDTWFSGAPKTEIFTSFDKYLKSGKKYYFKVRAVKDFYEDESVVKSKFSKKVRSKKLK